MRRVLAPALFSLTFVVVFTGGAWAQLPACPTGSVPINGTIRFADASGSPVSPEKHAQILGAIRWQINATALQLNAAGRIQAEILPTGSQGTGLEPDGSYQICVNPSHPYGYRVRAYMGDTDYVPEIYVEPPGSLHAQLRDSTAQVTFDVNLGQTLYPGPQGLTGIDFLVVPYDYYSPPRRNGTLVGRLVRCEDGTALPGLSSNVGYLSLRLADPGQQFAKNAFTDQDGRLYISPVVGAGQYHPAPARLPGINNTPSGTYLFRLYVDGKWHSTVPFLFQPDKEQDLPIFNLTPNEVYRYRRHWVRDFESLCVRPTPPIAAAGPDQEVEGGAAGATVLLDGSGSMTASGGTLSFRWVNESGATVATAGNAYVALPPGAHTFTLLVTESNAGSASDAVTIRVRDVVTPLQEENALLRDGYAVCSADLAVATGQMTDTTSHVQLLTDMFRTMFSDPSFTIPGTDVTRQVESLRRAIGELNYGQLLALYRNLGGAKGPKK